MDENDWYTKWFRCWKHIKFSKKINHGRYATKKSSKTKKA